MGTWGPAILSDDLAADVHADYLARYDEGAALETIADELGEAYAEERNDPDEEPVFWLALARAQWECGTLDPAVLAEVEDIVANGRGLDRWREAGPKQLAKRERALAAFLSQIRTPQEKPRKRRPRRLRDAVYAAGDCLPFGSTTGLTGPPSCSLLGTRKEARTSSASSATAPSHHRERPCSRGGNGFGRRTTRGGGSPHFTGCSPKATAPTPAPSASLPPRRSGRRTRRRWSRTRVGERSSRTWKRSSHGKRSMVARPSNPPHHTDAGLHRLARLSVGVYFATINGCIARRG